MSKTILIVDDDVELCSLMKDFFAQQGLRTECAHDGQAGLVRALEGGFDLLILDAMLPVLDGFELLRLLRKQSAIPVIMLTALGRSEGGIRIRGARSACNAPRESEHAPRRLSVSYGCIWKRSCHRTRPIGSPCPFSRPLGWSIKFAVIKTRWRWHRQTVATGYWSSQIRRFRCANTFRTTYQSYWFLGSHVGCWHGVLLRPSNLW
jgi:CheY-like chemotaxis protein